MSIRDLRKSIEKRFGDDSLSSSDKKVEKISSGILSLDMALGGGYPKGRLIEVRGWESSGKCLDVNTLALTPSGWVKMGDLRVGDKVFASDGKPHEIKGVYPQGKIDTYKVTFSDKSSILCSLDHLWIVRQTDGINTEYQVKPLSEIINNGLLCEECSPSYYRWEILSTQPIEYEEEMFYLAPYSLGALLASNISDEKLSDYGLGMTNKNKHIPTKYFYGSIQQRKDLLAGLLDMGGMIYCDSITFSSLSKKMVEDVRLLVLSLGGICFIEDSTVVGGLIQHNITVKTTFDPCFIKRGEYYKGNNDTNVNRKIVNIEQVEQVEQVCISVDSPDNSYVVENYIVTHNTTVTLTACAEIQKKTGKAIGYIDTEYAIDLEYTQRLGVDISEDKFLLVQPTTAEDALEVAREMAKSSEIGCIVIDSIASMCPKCVLDGEAGDAKMGVLARLLSTWIPTLIGVITKSDCIVFCINQFREKIGVMYGDNKTTPGGNAIKFYSSQIIEVSRIGQEKEGEDVVANRTRVKVIKNKVAPPMKKAEFQIAFGEGVDKETDFSETLMSVGLIEQRGAWVFYGETRVGRKKEVAQWLNDNPKIKKELTEKLFKNETNISKK